MKTLIRNFIKYPILGHVILVAIFLFGYFGLKNLKTTFFPPIPSKTIMVTASYPGASPEEIEEGIVLKIEDNLKRCHRSRTSDLCFVREFSKNNRRGIDRIQH